MATLDDAAGYAELHCLSNFTFLRGASHPHELVERAQALGYAALALTDECSVAGIVRALVAAERTGLQLIVGAEFRLDCALRCVVLAMNRSGYARLCRLITRGRRAARKGSYLLTRADLADCLRDAAQDCAVIWLPDAVPDVQQGAFLAALCPGTAWLGVELLCEGNDRSRLAALRALGTQLGLACVACGDVHMHSRGRRRLQDALTAIRLRVPLAQAGRLLHPSGERHLREVGRLRRMYPPELLAESLRIAARCRFSLRELRYEYPRELVPAGHTPISWLRQLTQAGAHRHWPDGVPPDVAALIEKELALIAELGYESFFLTVQDIVAEARRRHILCQGRGSAANSAVCYCLGVTAVPPGKLVMLFERFVSRERNEPPDIDVDFEHERREEIIQYLYDKYGRERAALAATVISYRPRSALRDLSMALGFDAAEAARMSRAMQWWDGGRIEPQRLREAGFDPGEQRVAHLMALTNELVRFPRHLSQHVGGFVISAGPLDALVPVENATMPERTVIQWDKNDLEDLGLLKVDVLGLGMLTAIRRCFDLVAAFTGAAPLTLERVPQDDPQVYAMIGRADTIGVFQVESRAQMAMLPRLRPANYYDLVIEVAIVRPGPIMGDMVHPYLRRRDGKEAVSYPKPEVEQVLKRTLGVPIFQEQVMQLAVVAAGFTPGEADELRRAMGRWKQDGNLGPYEERLLRGLRERDYPQEFAQRIIAQIRGFSDYGFPESHAASFALLVYVSAWLKCHHPAAFTAALLNSLPMGFYQPAQLVRDLRAHGVAVRGVDIAHSGSQSSLERDEAGAAVLRLGFDLVKSLPAAAAQRIVRARCAAPFRGVQDLGERAALDRGALEALAAAGALQALGGHRHRAYWNVAGFERPLPAAPPAPGEAALPLLRAPSEAQDIAADYRSTGLTLRRHPVALLRERFAAAGACLAADLPDLAPGALVRVVGLVIARQRPPTASGVTFVTLEDESGGINVIVWRRTGERQRRELVYSRLLEVHGELQRESGVIHVIARRLVDHSRLVGGPLPRSRDFH